MALTQHDPPSLVASMLCGASGASSTEDAAPYYAPTYFPPTYFYGGAGSSSAATDSAAGQTPYYAPTYFPPTYFYGGGGDSTTATAGQTPYYAPTYFPPSYFPSGTTIPITAATPSKPIPGRDGPCYAALIAELEATGVFAAVVFGDPTRQNKAGADTHPLAVITPKGWEEADDTDPTLDVRRVLFVIRVVIRIEEDASPFDRLDRLAAAVQACVDQSDLNGQCVGPLTKIRAGHYLPSSQYPEWSVDLDGEFSVLIDPIVATTTA